MTRPLLLTTGEPAGIGPELALMLAARGQLANTVAVGDPQMLRQRAALLGLAVEVVEAAPGGLDISSPGRLVVWPATLRAPATPGVLDPANARYVLESTLR